MYETNCRSLAFHRTKIQGSHSHSCRPIIILAVLACVVICAWLGREALLRGAASLWIVSDLSLVLMPLLYSAEIFKNGR
jgi:hypothetical protein